VNGPRLSRRAVLGGAAAGALIGPKAALAAPRGTGDLVREAVDLEQHAVVVYGAGAEGLSGDLAETCRVFGDQDREHAEGLSRVLRHFRGEPPLEPEGPHAVRGLESAVEGGPETFARFALRLEEAAVAFYYEAQAELRDKALLSATVSIMANQSQHLVVLRRALGREPLPSAFETGGVG